jgi:glycosyltransferase involved in cell wall biosynthesis
MTLNDITPLVLTYNEAPNIARCLERLRWAQAIVVVDSASTDETEAIVVQHPNAKWLLRTFDDHTTQWNFGVDHAPTDWVLALDADYILTDAFIAELRDWQSDESIDACFAPFRYCIEGRPLRACLYPPRAVLFRKSRCRYVPDGHTQLLHIPGKSWHFKAAIDHDDRKSLTRWIWSQDRYALLEAEKLLAADPATLRIQDKLRLKLIYAPVVTLLYTLFARKVILDGWHGWFYAFQRMLAEIMLSLRLLERRLKDEG